MTDWLATILIFLPLAGAIIVWLLPIPRVAGPIALLFALAEVGFWITALARMDFDSTSVTPNFDQQVTWRGSRSWSWRRRSHTGSGSGVTGLGPTSG